MKKLITVLCLIGMQAFSQTVVVAHRPDLTPEPIDFTHELALTNWTNSTTWLTGRMANSTNLLDYSAAKTDVRLAGGACGTFGGVGYIAVAGLTTNTTVTSWEGTATNIVISAGAITPTEGTVYNLLLSNGSRYPLAEMAGTTVCDVSTNAAHGTLTSIAAGMAVFWAGSQNTFFWNAEKGASKVLNFNGANSYVAANNSTNLNFGSSDFSIRWKGYLKIENNWRCLIGKGISPGNIGFWLRHYGATLTLTTTSNGTTQINSTVGALTSPDYAYYDIYINKSGSNVTGIVNGTTRTANNVVVNIYPSSAPIEIGSASIGTIFRLASDYVYSEIECPSFSFEHYAKNAYGTTLPDSAGTNNATLVNTSFRYIPALASGTNDTEGLGLTNPKGYVHNNAEHSLVIGGVTNTYGMLLTNGNATVNAPVIEEYWK